MERGAFCQACGDLGEDEVPLYGGYGDYEDTIRLRCPREDCDEVVSFLYRDRWHGEQASLPALPGGIPPLHLYMSPEWSDWGEVIEWWKRGHQHAVVHHRGVGPSGSGEKNGEAGRAVPAEVIGPQTDPAPLGTLTTKALPIRCGCCENRVKITYASLIVVSGGMVLGRCVAAACKACLLLLGGKIEPEELCRLPRSQWGSK
jgi:hypothetical protein